MLFRSRHGVLNTPLALARPRLPTMSGLRYSRRRITAPCMGLTRACFGQGCSGVATLAASGLGDQLGWGQIEKEAHGKQAVPFLENGVLWPMVLGQ